MASTASAVGRVGYDAAKGGLETGCSPPSPDPLTIQSSGTFPIHFNRPIAGAGLGKATVDTLDGVLTHSLNVFETHIDRSLDDVTSRSNKLPQNTTSIVSIYRQQPGAEYQGNLKMGPLAR